ncbi:MAG TPA: efflux RND transporter periplasmic adaptor subunit [Pyrinomonadaceae bacterium]|nr:efflux RND transporter periplasmic adaptor subunit [Pyrinomonadaceae bacterium]
MPAFLLCGTISVILLGAACGSSSANSNANANTQVQAVDVTTAQAVVHQIPSYFEATGSLASDESTDVAPTIAGKVIEVNFDVGSYVAKGSVLVRLDPRDARLRLEQAQAGAEQARKGVDSAAAAVRQAQAKLGVPVGSHFAVDEFPQVRSLKANLLLAEKELTRAENLFKTGDISRSILDQRRATRDSLAGQLADARANAQVAEKAISSAQAQEAAAKAAVASAEAQVDQAKKAVNDTAILAPISGFVSERTADPGEYVSPSVPNPKIATIMRTSTLRMKIEVPEQSIELVKPGQSISLQTSAYPDRNFVGKVVRIAPSLNVTARTLTVEADVPNPDGALKPGQFATVRITKSQPENAVMIPAAAVRADGDINKVFVVKDGVAREVIVQLGLLENDLIQVKNGLAENDVIATNNLAALFDGVRVTQ